MHQMSDNHKNPAARRAALKQVTAFSQLDDEALDHISHLVHWKEHARGAEIIAYKGEGSEVFFLVEGRARVTTFSASGKEISYEDIFPGEMFGELAAIDDLPRVANVIALQPALTASLSKSDFWQTINKYQEVAGAVLQRLAFLVRLLCDRVYQYGALDVKDRVRLEILRLARNNMTDENSAVIPHMPTHFEIASRINTHREAVTRELNELSRVELIEQKKRVLVVKNVSRLAELLPEDV